MSFEQLYPTPVANTTDQDNKKIQSQIKKVEQEIERLESEIKTIDNKLSVPSSYDELTKDPNFFNSYNKLKKDLEAEMAKWEELSARLA